MSKVIGLPENFVSLEDRKRLESYGGHQIARGRATRFDWSKDADGNPVFDIYRGGAHEELVTRIRHARRQCAFQAENNLRETIASGTLNHVMAVLEDKFRHEHGEK